MKYFNGCFISFWLKNAFSLETDFQKKNYEQNHHLP